MSQVRPVPDDFVEFVSTAKAFSRRTLMQRWRAGPRVVARWLQETGATTKPSGVRAKSGPKRTGWRNPKTEQIVRPEGLDAAANYLRMHYANVHKCCIHETLRRRWGTNRGLPNGGRGLYFVDGVGVITNEQLLELARKNGYVEKKQCA